MPVEHRVIGPPGTGKTSYLQRQVPRAVGKVGEHGILIASLTRAAAQEIAGRKLGLPKGAVGTLHAHAYRVLDRPQLAETPEGLQAWNTWLHDQGEVGAWRIEPSAGRDLDWTPAEQRANRKGEELLSLLSTYRARELDPEFWKPEVRRFAATWSSFKASSDRLDFTDLIERAIEEGYPPGSPAIMMLDEAQDLSHLEMRLARRWAEKCEQLVVVGDPDQCLYAWRGTDPEAMFHGQAASETVLEQSYRVPAAVHEYAVSWIKETPADRPDVEYRPRLLDPEHPEKGAAAGEVAYCPHPWRDPTGVVVRALEDLEKGKSVMMLASCGYMLEPLIADLKHRGIPYHNPYRVTHGGWNPLRGAQRLVAYLRPDPATWGEEASVWTWDELRRWIEPVKAANTLARGAKTFIDAKCSHAADEKAPIQTVADLFADLETADKALSLDVDAEGAVSWWENSLLTEPSKMMRYPLTVYRRQGGAALREEPRLVVGTIHSVKGGEADSVYVFPDLSRRGWMLNWDKPTTRASTYRMFYVAFTRAREKLTICAPAGSHEYAKLPRPW